jgi:SDR family mycofactocin-dependent oxidoreductase
LDNPDRTVTADRLELRTATAAKGESSMGRVEGKVAFITGAARGQGRAHAVRLAEEGADIIALDACAPVAEVTYPPATPEDLAETVELVKGAGRRIVAHQADVRDFAAVEAACRTGADELGGIHIVVANAGVSNWNRFWEMSGDQWRTMIDINLTGVWHTLKAAAPIMIDQAQGGSMILVSSVGGLKALPGSAHYVAAKHGVVGLCRTAAVELGPFGIRVNSIHPWGVDTPMGEHARLEQLIERYPTYAGSYGSILPSPAVALPADIAEAVLWLASEESRIVTGAQIPLDMGATKV